MMMISNLPRDLESEILSRVPANSLAKLKTTCKRWYFLFNDPKFTEKNLAKATAKELILLMNFGIYSISVNLHGIHQGIDPSMEFIGKLSCLKDSNDLEISQIFHCDGLMLCLTEDGTRLVVWSPCTGETMCIKPRSCYDIFDNLAIGYGSNKYAYKILRFSSYCNHLELRAVEYEIYDFSSGSWRVLDDFTQKWIIFCTGVTLKGNTYWVASDGEADHYNTFLSFDFTAERFGSFPLPYQSKDHEDIVLSIVKEEQTALLHQNNRTFSSDMRIWLTNKIDEGKEVSWSKFLVVDYDKFALQSFDSVITFLVDEENKVVVCCSKDDDGSSYAYIVGEDLHKQVYKENTKGSFFGWPCLLSYVPSLVRI